MSELMTKILPLALAGAISPTVLAVVLVVLSGKEDPKLRGLAFLAGTTTVVVAISLLVVFVLGAAVPDSQKGSNSDLSGYVDLGFAVLLLALAGLTFARRNHHREKHHDSARQPGARLPRFYALGLLIMIFNFTTLAVFLPALKEIAIDKVSDADRLTALIVVDVIVLTPAWLPVLLYLISPRMARKVLNPLNDFLTRHRVAVGVGICLVFAAYLTYLGLKALSG
ncbi:MAG: GAP family protein [Solirubrobacterales bacterium]